MLNNVYSYVTRKVSRSEALMRGCVHIDTTCLQQRLTAVGTRVL